MNRLHSRRAQSATIWVTVLLLAVSGRAEPEASKTLPNIVVIIADDVRSSDLACYGNRDRRTPNVDALAEHGATFLHAYRAAPFASASHAAVLTGVHPAALQLTNDRPAEVEGPGQLWFGPAAAASLPKDIPTLATRLKGAGYSTGLIGSWALCDQPGDRPADRGFDFTAYGNSSPESGDKSNSDPAATAGKFIDQTKDAPFLLVICKATPRSNPEGNGSSTEAAKSVLVDAAAVKRADEWVGRLLAKLDDAHLSQRTLVVFTSASGAAHATEAPSIPGAPNSPLCGEDGFLGEAAVSVPLIIRWPGVIKPMSKVTVPVTQGDLTHTFTEAAKIAGDWGKPYDGVSLMKVLASPDDKVAAGAQANRALFWHVPHYTRSGSRPAGAIREGSWKLVEDYDFGGASLYDLTNDPGQRHDVSMKESTRTADLRGKLAAWRMEIEAGTLTPNPDARFGFWKVLYRDADPLRFPELLLAEEFRPKELEGRSIRAAINRSRGGGSVGNDDAETAKLLDANPPGFIVLAAKDAKIHLGPDGKLRYESQPQKNTLGYWVSAGDSASWDFNVKYAGTYAVYVLQGCGGGSGGAEVEISINGAAKTVSFAFTVQETGHFQNFVSREVGTLKLETGQQTLSVQPKSKPGAAVMDLRRVTLVRVK